MILYRIFLQPKNATMLREMEHSCPCTSTTRPPKCCGLRLQTSVSINNVLVIALFLTVDIACLYNNYQQCFQPPFLPIHVGNPPTAPPWLEDIVSLVGLLAGLAQEETLAFTGSLSLLGTLQMNIMFDFRNFISRES